MLEIPIRVLSFGGSAGDFSEDTRTLMVNRDGALIVLNHRVGPDEIVRIINLENFREADFRVVGPVRQEGGEANHWGVECLDRDRSLWDIDFPRPLDIKDSRGGALLKCKGCGKESLLVLSLTEISILDSSGAIEKLCETCGELSSWQYAEEHHTRKSRARQSDSTRPQHSAESASAPLRDSGNASVESRPPLNAPQAAHENSFPNGKLASGGEIHAEAIVTQAAREGQADETNSTPAPKWDGKSERRVHKRLTMKLPVLVRNQKGESEIARTENISKGGLGVGLEMVLALGERLTVICPYTGSGSEIEQKADVRRRVSLYGGKKWFYGLRYIPL